MSCTRVEYNWITQGYYGHFEDHYDIDLVLTDDEKTQEKESIYLDIVYNLCKWLKQT